MRPQLLRERCPSARGEPIGPALGFLPIRRRRAATEASSISPLFLEPLDRFIQRPRPEANPAIGAPFDFLFDGVTMRGSSARASMM